MFVIGLASAALRAAYSNRSPLSVALSPSELRVLCCFGLMMVNEEVGSNVISVRSFAKAEVSGSHRGQGLQI